MRTGLRERGGKDTTGPSAPVPATRFLCKENGFPLAGNRILSDKTGFLPGSGGLVFKAAIAELDC